MVPARITSVEATPCHAWSTGPTVWWHWTADPTVILGAGQLAAEVDLEACKAAGIHVVKRHSGGTTVYADPSLLGLDVALPPGHPLVEEDVVESYRWLGEVWAAGPSVSRSQRQAREH